MNKLLLALNAVLIIAVAFLFYKVNSINGSVSNADTKNDSVEPKTDSAKKIIIPTAIGTPPTGKIAYLNLDVLNEKSLQVIDLIKEAKNRKASIEASLETLSANYQKKMQDYQAELKTMVVGKQQKLDRLGYEAYLAQM